MDRRIALFALCVLVLYGCDDRSSYCKKKGCNNSHDDDESSASWGNNEVEASGTVSYDGAMYTFPSDLTAYTAGIDVRNRAGDVEDEEDDAGIDAGSFDAGSLDAGVGDAEAEADADADADADASADAAADAKPEAGRYDAGSSPGSSYSPSYYDTATRMRISFAPPSEIGVHPLEAVNGFAVVCPRGKGLEAGTTDWCIDREGHRSIPTKIRLTGTFEVLDIRTEDVSTEGAPTGRPYELPWGWHIKSTNPDFAVDVRAEAKPSWYVPTNYCD